MIRLLETPVVIPDEMQSVILQREADFFSHTAIKVAARIDRMFAYIMVAQWIAAILAAVIITPRNWIGATSAVHVHVIAAIVIGGCLALPSILLYLYSPGQRANRYAISVTQMLFSTLLIHLTGGRIETHFHIFASLAFLALYREWQVLVPATLIAALDHLIRGVYWPEFVFGIANPSSWRWLEHVTWVACEDVVLMIGCLQSHRESHQLAKQVAHLSVTRTLVDLEVHRQLVEINKTNERLRDSERRTRLIIDTAYDAFVVIDADGAIVDWNMRAELLFGWTAGEAIGQKLGPLISIAPFLDEIASRRFQNWKSGERSDAVVRTRRQELVPVDAYVSFLELGADVLTNIFFHDNSEQRRMHLQLMHAQKMQSIGQLAAGIAHEINTPTQYATDNIRFIQDSMHSLEGLFACLMHDSLDQPDVLLQLKSRAASADLDYLRTEIPLAIHQALDGVQRIGEITRAMKEFSHPGMAAKQTTDLKNLIQNAIIVCRNEWKYTAELSTAFDSDVSAVPCLPGELSQVLVNLIVNAAQAIGESRREGAPPGKIAITVRRDDEWICIELRDNGPGIPDELIGRIFDPFFTTKEIGKGTGQGLAIAHSVIVDKHGGSLSVESAIGCGTVFVVRLPATDAALPLAGVR